MNKSILYTTATFLIIILFSIISFAQEKFKVGISMGNVTPLGEFGSIDFPNSNSGFSESGFTLNFDGDYKLHNRVSLSARINFGMTSMNTTEVVNWLESEMFDYLNEDKEFNRYSIDYWQWSSPMIGAKYNYPIVVNKLYFETGVFTGISIIQTPDQNLAILDETSKKEYFSENIKTTPVSIPIMADAGFRYVLNENMQIEIKSSYFQTKANYEHVNYVSNVESSVVSEELKRQEMSVPIKTLNVSVGIIYTIGNQK